MPEIEQIPDKILKDTVGDSFNIYQATVAMLSIFLGFVFAALLQLLSGADALSKAAKFAVILLVGANLCLLGALLFHHLTANQVVRYWKIFFPKSVAQKIGSALIVVGIVFMQFAISALLWGKDMCVMAAVVFIVTLGVFAINYHFGQLHKDAPYLRKVD